MTRLRPPAGGGGDLYGPALSPTECGDFLRDTGCFHPSSRFCGLIEGQKCGFRDGEACDGWCHAERRAQRAKGRA
jgi:hypothetical protein